MTIKNEDEENKRRKRIEYFHMQRCMDEIIFQKMIHTTELEKINLETIKELSRNIGTLIRNFLYELEKNGYPTKLFDDDNFNDPTFIADLIKKNAIKT